MDDSNLLINMAKIEQKLDVISQAMEENKDDHQKLYNTLEKTLNNIDKRFNSLDKKYAAKYVERIFWFTLSTLLTLFISAIWYFIIKTQ